MRDLISRQAAIDAHYEYCNKHPDAGFPVWSLKILEDLPSAQPEKRTEERTETHACDLISRQAAIDALGEEPEVWTGKDEYAQGLNNQWHYDRNAIMALPSSQTEQRWIPCSERLPEERQEILATTTDNAWGDVVIIRTYYKEMHKSVIAWMPLPEPYRAERRTDE